MVQDPIDTHVGKRLETLRLARNLTLQAIADELGITYQQVRKYESAQNRISASTLYRLSQALRVQPSFFFEGLEGTAPTELTNETKQTLPSTEEQLLERVEDTEVRAALRYIFIRLGTMQLPSTVSAPAPELSDVIRLPQSDSVRQGEEHIGDVL